MSANNYIKIEETSVDKFRVAEKDYESDLDIRHLGDFDLLKLAIEKAEAYISDIEYEVEYGIRFALLDTKVDSKNFDTWNVKKKAVDLIEKRPFFHEREIWFCSLGANIGFEQDGVGEDFLRPVLILKKFNNEIFWGIPLTKSNKKVPSKSDAYYYKFSFLPGVISVAVLSQIRLIDARRLARHVGFISESEYQELTKKLKKLLP